ncbi:YciI family protein [Nakamurella lactea]|uniref:YciI family protein n=1 Tax=Nakamurella lactea TaxID=459515 RepID=UPI0004129F8E|nr:YciI family protein [Nakamurella lactea]
MPQYLLLIHESEQAYQGAGEDSFNEIMAMHNDFGEAVKAAGAKVVSGEALQPSSTATYLRGTRTADVQPVDNPAPELKEVLGGYYLIEAADDAQADQLGRLCPAPYGYIEVRPIWDFSQAQ